MVVAIHAFENSFGGLHGVDSHFIVEVDNIQQAENFASEESLEIMHSYDQITDDFYQEAESEGLEVDSEEYNQYIEECINSNIAYQIWEVVDCYDTFRKMQSDFYNDMDNFVKKHCRELE